MAEKRVKLKDSVEGKISCQNTSNGMPVILLFWFSYSQNISFSPLHSCF